MGSEARAFGRHGVFCCGVLTRSATRSLGVAVIALLAAVLLLIAVPAASLGAPGDIDTIVGGGYGSTQLSSLDLDCSSLLEAHGTKLFCTGGRTVREIDPVAATSDPFAVPADPLAGITGNPEHSYASTVAVGPGGDRYLIATDWAGAPTYVVRVDGSDGSAVRILGGGSEPLADGVLAVDADASPWDIDVDGAGNVYLAMSQQIWRVRADNGTMERIAGSGTYGDSGDGGPARSADLTVMDFAVNDAGDVALQQQELAGNRVRMVDATSGVISSLGAFGVSGAPSWTPSGDLLVADSLNGRLRRVDLPSGSVTLLAGTGVPGSSGDGGPATAAQVTLVGGAVELASGDVYLLDDRVLRRITAATGVIDAISRYPSSRPPDGLMGTEVSYPDFDSGLPTQGGLATTSEGDLVFVQRLGQFDGSAVVRRWSAQSGEVSTIAGGGTSDPGDGGSALQAHLKSVLGVAVGPDGDVYIAAYTTGSILRVDVGSGTISRVAGTGVGGGTGSGDGGPATSAKLSPSGALALDSAGNLYVGEALTPSSSNGVLRRVDAGSGVISTVAGTGTAGLGSQPWPADGSPATQFPLRGLGSLALDDDDTLIIGEGSWYGSDSSASRVGVVDLTAGTMHRLTWSSADPRCADDRVGKLSRDPAGRLIFESSPGEPAVCRTTPTRSRADLLAGTGVGGAATGDGGPALAATLGLVAQVTSTPRGDVIFEDGNRIRRIESDTPPPQTSLDNGPSGTVASANATFTFSSPDAGVAFECRLDDAAWTSCASPRSYQGLSDGAHVFQVRAKASGIVDPTPATRAWSVDTAAPETSISTGPSGTTGSAAAAFTFSSSEAGSSFECRLDSSPWGSCSSPKAYSGLPDGAHSFQVRAIDAAANADPSPATRAWTVDTDPPQTTVDGGPSGTVGSANASFAFSSTDGSASFECRLDSTVPSGWGPCASPRAYTALSDGPHTFEVRAIDAANNTDPTPATRAWTVTNVILPTLDPPAPAKDAAWGWGTGFHGQLGTAGTDLRLFAAEIEGFTGATALAAGWSHSLAVRSDGTVWASGNNGSGELGDGTTTQRSTPVRVSGLTGVAAVAAGSAHSLAVKSDGTVWAWGANWSGQLGDGTTTQRSTPVRVSGLTGVAAVAAGGAHSLAVKSDGTVWAWGDNRYGQLGDGTTTQRYTPVPVSGLTGVAAVAAGAGSYHSLAVKSDGTVRAWGHNSYGQLGDGTTTQRSTPVPVSGLTGVAALAAGSYHSLAVKSDGTVWASGNNWDGQLGDGTTTQRSTPVRVSGLTGVAALAAGNYHSLAVKSDGTVRAWGANWSGQLGDGTTTQRSTPVPVSGLTDVAALAAGSYHSLAVGRASPTQGVESFTLALPAGATVTTDVEQDGATPADPLETTLTTPVAGTVSIAETPSADFSVHGRSVQITAPAASAAEPLVIRFRLDASLYPSGWDLAWLSVYRNGDAVANCSGPGASPDPCVESRTRLADGDVELVARTSAASGWLIGRPGPAADAGGPYTVAEGSSVRLGGSVTGGEVPFRYRWSGAAGEIAQPSTARPVFTGLDDGTLTLNLLVTDAAGLTGLDDASVTVTNRPPVVSPLAVTKKQNRRLEIAAAFADAGRFDTHVASVRWGDGSQSAALVKESRGIGAATAGHTYSRKGTYAVEVTIRDDDGGNTSVKRAIEIP